MLQLKIKEQLSTPFVNKDGIFQDGTTPMCRDAAGTLWAMSGHSHKGYVAMFSGSCLDDLKQLYPIQTNFCVGHADFAFDGVRYPDGVKARGSIWPFGLYICPGTHRFYCFFHNESGWNCKGTGYDAWGPCEEPPRIDSDFRHIGLMHSDDEGQNWTFDRWVITANEPCFTELYNPGAGNVIGQKADKISFGSGDFSLFDDPNSEYLYLFYNIVRADMNAKKWISCDVYVARTRKRSDGIMGDFVKYYDGAFCEPGNFGKETALVKNAWHPRVIYLKDYNRYVMACVGINFDPRIPRMVEDIAYLCESEDLLSWSMPQRMEADGKPFGNHYVAIVSEDKTNPPCVAEGKAISVLCNHNATDVERFRAELLLD